MPRLWALLALATLAGGCGDPTLPADQLPESDATGHNTRVGEWAVAGDAQLVQTKAGLELVLGNGGRHIADFVVGAPALSADGARFAVSHRPNTATDTRIALGTWDGSEWVVTTPVERQWNPDEAALSPDGKLLAFASAARGGIASVWVLALDAEELHPEQLTNVGLVAGNGRPDGFVAPPLKGAPRFVGDTLQWDSAEGPQTVEVPR